MQIHRLSENTIKVILTKEDFIRRNIDVKKLQPGSQTYRQLVLEIMAQASGEFNFDANDCRLIVEGQMSLKNELTLLITKSPAYDYPAAPSKTTPEDILDKLPSPEELSKLIENALGIPIELPEELKSANEKSEATFPTDVVICFSDFDKLISLLHTMPSAKGIASSLYMYDEAYYLVLKVYERNADLAITFRNQASEFDGEQISSDLIIPALREHGTLVIKKGAIPLLLRKFSE